MKLNNIITTLIRLGVYYPWKTLFLILLFSSTAIIGNCYISFSNDYQVFFSKENPELSAFQKMQKTYKKSDSVIFVVEPKDGNVFSNSTLSAIKELTELSWQLPFSSRVESITNFQHTIAKEDELLVADLVSKPQDLTIEDLRYIKNIALNEPLLVNRLISKRAHVTTVNITVQLPGKSPSEATNLTRKARELITQFESRYPSIKLHLTGIVVLSNSFREAALMDNKNLIPIMFVIITLILWLCLRSVVATLTVLILIVFSILSALGLGFWFGIKLSPPSATAPIIIMTIAVANCVHLLVTMLHNMRLDHSKKEAIQESLRINFQPMFLASSTTTIGFLAMNFSDSPPFRDLGNIVAMGCIIAFILSILFLPALLTLLPIKVKKTNKLNNSYMKYLAEFVIKKRKLLLFTNGIITMCLISFIPQNQINDDFIKYFDESFEFRHASDFLNQHIGGLYTIQYSLQTGKQDGILNPVFLKKVEQYKTWLLTQAKVIHVNSITDIFKRLNKNMHNDDMAWYKLPEQSNLAAQYLLLYEMSLPYGLDLNDQINTNKSATRLIVTLENISTQEVLAIEQQQRAWLNANFAPYQTENASPLKMFAHIGKRNIASMIEGTVLALALISILLMLAFRSIKLGLISLIPNILPVSICFGIWAMVDGAVGISSAVIVSMTLGVVVDDTVHFISKYHRARIEKAYSSQKAVSYAFSTVAIALWITSLVLVCGFFVLGQSHFKINADMGFLNSITIAIALLLDFLFLPPLLMTLDRKKYEKNYQPF